MKKKKFLLIRFSAIGDIVLTSPVIRCIKQQLGAEIHFLSKNAYRPILATNPYIDKIYTIKKRVGEVASQLRQEQYDSIIDLHKNLRSFLVKLNLPFTKSYSFNKLNFEKWLLVNFKINRLPKKHLVDRYFEALQPLGIQNDGAGLDFFLHQSDQALPVTLPREFTAVVIGAGRNTKAPTIQKWIAIIKGCSEAIVLLGGPAEKEKAAKLIEACSLEIRSTITNLVGQINLQQSAYCIQQADKVITGDTGLMHIAAAFHKPIVSIWGNTVPAFGMYPYYGAQVDQNRVVEVKGLACRPCSKIGFDVCPQGHFKCMEKIDTTFLK